MEGSFDIPRVRPCVFLVRFLSMQQLYEDRGELSAKTLDMKRAIDSFREEMEAIDWYKQRAEACADKNLRKILLHNAKEEKEHAIMLLAWIRQQDTEMDDALKTYVSRAAGKITEE
jgi:hypothetical protein